MTATDQAAKAVYFPEIPGTQQLLTTEDQRLSGQDLLPASTPADRILDEPWVLRAGDTMTGALGIVVDNSASLVSTHLLKITGSMSDDFTALNSRLNGIKINLSSNSSDENQTLIDVQIGEVSET
jgi:hypothetical protein